MKCDDCYFKKTCYIHNVDGESRQYWIDNCENKALKNERDS